MNFFKKKLKPLASSFTSSTNTNNTNKNLEDDLYDEYVIEAPPHPSELIALGVDPTEIDVNDPDKLRELYRKAKEEGKDRQTNSVLLAKQRQKEEIEEKKRTREEWKFFDNLTSRVEQVVKDSQKTLEQLKDRSAVNKLDKPEYELRQTADEVFRPASTVKREKGENDWIAFGDTDDTNNEKDKNNNKPNLEGEKNGDELDCFGCPKRKTSLALADSQVAVELLEDLGIDLRTEEQKRAEELKRRREQEQARRAQAPAESTTRDINIQAAARPRPRVGALQANDEQAQDKQEEDQIDPFDTSFLAEDKPAKTASAAEDKIIDPFDTSYVNL